MKAVELTKNEREVLVAIVANAKYYGEDNNFVLDEIEIYRSSASLKGTTSSLQKKGMIQMDNEGYYFSGQVTEAGLHEVESSNVNNNQEVKTQSNKSKNMATNKKVAKGGKVETKKEEKPKELTIDEFVALPTKSAKTNKKPSEAQKEALKLIMKGYRVTADHKFFENAEGDKKACNWESVTAMLRRYGMEYVPAGLVK